MDLAISTAGQLPRHIKVNSSSVPPVTPSKSESWSNYFGTRQGTVGAELHAEQAKNHLTDFFFLMKSAERASITCTPLYLIQSRGSLVVVTN
jgi:hypothetical protein